MLRHPLDFLPISLLSTLDITDNTSKIEASWGEYTSMIDEKFKRMLKYLKSPLIHRIPDCTPFYIA